MLARLLRLLMCGFLVAFGQDLVCPMGDLYTRALPLHGYQACGGGHQFGLPIQTDPTLLSLKRRCFRRSFTASLQGPMPPSVVARANPTILIFPPIVCD